MRKGQLNKDRKQQSTYKTEEREILKANLAHILGDTGILTDRWDLEEKSIISQFPPPPPLFENTIITTTTDDAWMSFTL